MGRSARKKKLQEARKWAFKQYEKHKRHNQLFAKPGRYDFVLILDNLKPSYNIGKIFRSADAFGAAAVHLIGIDYFEVKSAKGAFKTVPAHFHLDFDSCYTSLAEKGYRFFTLEPETGEPLWQRKMCDKSAFILGHEEYGLSFDPLQYAGITPIKVEQVGRVQSLNVSIAASVVMYEYFRQKNIEG